ncbi:sulfurtransferase [Aneurinibacillus thermoaerophilus]|nr:sulfurtransferase [Aneurinibacillus thermoaerophilus]
MHDRTEIQGRVKDTVDMVVSVSWLAEHLHDEKLAVVDCRFVLGQPEKGRDGYKTEHIPGAIYFDLEQDLSAPKAVHGGRHPWPDADVFATKLGQVGIDNDTAIVLYDEQQGVMAARAYWVLRYVGHEKLALLNGGFPAWKAAGYPVTAEMPKRSSATYVPRVRKDLLRNVDDVRRHVKGGQALLVDSRAHNRYTGEVETIDPVGGHIPGAVNYEWQCVVDETGKWKDEKVLREHFSELPRDREVIVYCGSGVTACANLFALERLGYENAKLYAGSWSDWISYPDNPVATGNG